MLVLGARENCKLFASPLPEVPKFWGKKPKATTNVTLMSNQQVSTGLQAWPPDAVSKGS